MRVLFLILCLFLQAASAGAAVVQLKNGQTVEGAILEQNNQSIKVDVQGVAMTYFIDEVTSIDGNPLKAAIPAVEAPLQTSNKKELILKFIEVFGTRQALESNFAAMLEQMPPEQAKEKEAFQKNVKISEIVERLIPLYDKHFTAEELQAFVDFYGSANGKKLIAMVPVLMEESVEVSSKYLEEKIPENKAQ